MIPGNTRKLGRVSGRDKQGSQKRMCHQASYCFGQLEPNPFGGIWVFSAKHKPLRQSTREARELGYLNTKSH